MSKSANVMTTPRLCCSPSSLPASRAVSFVYGYTVKSARSSVEEGFAAKTPFRRGRAMKAVNQFGQADGGERRVLITGCADDSAEQALDRFSAPFCIDDYAGVEDQSHAGGFSGSRWLSTAASTSLAKSSSSVAVEPCSRARRRDSDSNRTAGSAG